jgi:hypothetical protein
MAFEGVQLYDFYPIMAYLARRFNREDLLGRDIRQRVPPLSFRPGSKKY